jgi:hypothetical protein
MATRNKYFAYSAYGSAFGGVITKPNPLTIPTQAMVSLSPSGGYGTSSVENFGVRDLAFIRKAISTVQGDGKQTEVTVTIEDADLAGVMQFSRIVMHLTCTADPRGHESSISPIGSTIEGLRVNGSYIDLVNKADVFNTCATYTALERAYVEGGLRGLVLAPGSLGAPCGAKDMNGCVTRQGNVRTTIFPLDQIKSPFPVENGGIRIKEFGTLYLGQMTVSKYTRNLTMLRVELGCDREGSGGYGSGGGMGQEEPPS